MIKFLHHLFIDDFLLKLFSLALAIVVWLIVTFASQKEAGTTPRIFYNLPVTVLSATEDVRKVKVSPNEVIVTVQGGPKTLERLQSTDVRAVVDLTGVTAARGVRQRVEVSVPSGVTFMRVVPEEVRLSFPPER
jgi:YbbR domain-containing protein